MSEKTITILVPTYRRPNLLKRAIESILKQTYSDFLIIISDNGSCDGTAVVLNEFIKKDSRVNFYIQDRNIGMNANFNFLFSKVKTKYFCMLTDDDYYKDNFLYDAIAGFENSETAMFSILSCPAITESGGFIKNQLDNWPHEGIYSKGKATHLFLNGNHPVFTAIVFKSEILEDIVFNTEFGNISDIPLLVKLSIKYDFYMSRKLGLYFVRHSGVISNTPQNQNIKIKERICLVNEYDRLIKGNALVDNENISRILIKKKIMLLGGITKDFKSEGRMVICTIEHPIKYLLRIHLYLINFTFYTKGISFFKKIVISRLGS